MLTITLAVTARDFVIARRLLRAYAADLPDHQGSDAALADVASLPGPYLPPAGGFYLAALDGEPVGCVALARFDAETAEVKRMFVQERARRHGVGRALLARLQQDARTAGYRRLRLGTIEAMTAARRLYAEMGFVPIPDYRASHTTVDTLFFECDLYGDQ
jgi:GNAT superfamily N-acetyltransferase